MSTDPKQMMQKETTIEQVTALGAGVIGASWTALFLAAGLKVRVYDPDPDVEEKVRAYIAKAWPVLTQMGMTDKGTPESVSFYADATAAVQGSQFIQESVPERIAIKHNLFQAIEPHLSDEAIVASSASGLTISAMQTGWNNPSRFILGHPFNPPHLIPLVELMGNEKTDEGVLETAESFYQKVGKTTIRVNKEVPAHVANRLQAALWKEAIHLVQAGVASVEDVDKAVWAGPGLRWAAHGPHMLFHLGAGDGGLEEFCNRYRDSFQHWWDDLGDAKLDPASATELMQGVLAEAKGMPLAALAEERDAIIANILTVNKSLRGGEK